MNLVSGLRDAIKTQQRGLSDLRASCNSAQGWQDDARQSFDGQIIDELERDGRALLERLRSAAHGIASAQQRLIR